MSRKFRIPQLRIPIRRLPNRCILCGRIIQYGSICSYCSNKKILGGRR